MIKKYKLLLILPICFVIFITLLPLVMVKWSGAPLLSKPGLITRLGTYFTTNVAETSEDSVFPELITPRYEKPSDELWGEVKQAVEKLGWEIDSINDDGMEVKAVITTTIMQYQDDILIRVYSGDAGKSSLFIQSSSRVGKGDLGANTGHILSLLAHL